MRLRAAQTGFAGPLGDRIWQQIDRSKHLLLNRHYSIEEIAKETGFRSVDQFREAFCKITAHQPEDYRWNPEAQLKPTDSQS